MSDPLSPQGNKKRATTIGYFMCTLFKLELADGKDVPSFILTAQKIREIENKISAKWTQGLESDLDRAEEI